MKRTPETLRCIFTVVDEGKHLIQPRYNAVVAMYEALRALCVDVTQIHSIAVRNALEDFEFRYREHFIRLSSEGVAFSYDYANFMYMFSIRMLELIEFSQLMTIDRRVEYLFIDSPRYGLEVFPNTDKTHLEWYASRHGHVFKGESLYGGVIVKDAVIFFDVLSLSEVECRKSISNTITKLQRQGCVGSSLKIYVGARYNSSTREYTPQKFILQIA